MQKQRFAAETVVIQGKRFAVYAVHLTYDAWHKSPTGFYGWAREVGTKRRDLMTGVHTAATDAVEAAKTRLREENADASV